MPILRTFARAALVLVVVSGVTIGVGGQYLSPNNVFLYMSGKDGNSDLFLTDVHVGLEYNLTQSEDYETTPIWSPDGNSVAFLLVDVPVGDSRDLYAMDFNGANLRPITHQQIIEREPKPAWSPNGLWIAYLVRDSTGTTLNVVTVDMNERSIVLPNVSYFAWQPQSNKLTVIRQGSLIENVDVRTDERQILSSSEARKMLLSWSPDGQKLSFFVINRGYRLNVIDADGTLLNESSHLGMPCGDTLSWSPDGQELLFALFTNELRNGSGCDLYIVNPSTGNNLRLTQFEINYYAQEPAWSPDGDQIVFEGWGPGATNEIYLINADGSDLRQLTENRAYDESAVWRP